jgi:hypothetical protein
MKKLIAILTMGALCLLSACGSGGKNDYELPEIRMSRPTLDMEYEVEEIEYIKRQWRKINIQKISEEAFERAYEKFSFDRIRMVDGKIMFATYHTVEHRENRFMGRFRFDADDGYFIGLRRGDHASWLRFYANDGTSHTLCNHRYVIPHLWSQCEEEKAHLAAQQTLPI